MQPITMPDVLDPSRSVLLAEPEGSGHDSAERLERAQRALTQACEYGQQLWHELDSVRSYLRADVAEGDGAAVASLLRSTDQWHVWAHVYSEVCSALSGPRGDRALGESEARLIAREHGAELPPLTPPDGAER